MGTTNLHKQLKRFRSRLRRSKRTLQIAALVLIASAVGYAGYMSNQRLSVDPTTYQNLLHLIGAAESNNNYNAYFGNAGNSRIIFTDMTVAEVLDWQHTYILQGNASSAVGKYQFLNGTLEGLVEQLGLSHDEKFSPAMQDKLAIALLERRGAIEYVNSKLSNKEFAANLAKEWAALPRTIGENPETSYYTGDGLNASRVKVTELLKAIEPINSQK